MDIWQVNNMNLFKKFKIQVYNVGFVNSTIDKVLLNGIKKGDIKWIKHGYKDRFFADPFLIREDSDYYYVLCEEYIFIERKGKISLLKISKNDFHLVEKQVIIEENYHLSFPFCEFDGNFIIPESCNGDGTYKYTIDDKFNVISKKKIVEEGLVDAVFYKNNDNEYILTCKKENPKTDLYLYVKKHEMYEITSPKPILSNIKYSRSAGHLFFNKNKLYRPVQDSTNRYGELTRIVEITQLTNNSYDYQEVCEVDAFDNPPYNETLHTFNCYNNVIVIDGSKDYFKPAMKIKVKLMNAKKHRRIGESK